MDTVEAEAVRAKVWRFFLALRSHLLTLHTVGKPEYLATLTQLKDAIFAHANISHELFSLQNGESDIEKRLPLSCAVTISQQTDSKIDDFISIYCGFDGHPRATFSHEEAATLLIKEILGAMKDQKQVVHEYKRANDKLWAGPPRWDYLWRLL